MHAQGPDPVGPMVASDRGERVEVEPEGNPPSRGAGTGNAIGRTLARQALNGAAAGFLATLPMTVSMWAITPTLPRAQRFHLPPRQITVELAERAGLVKALGLRERQAVAGLLHFGFGALTGGVYGVIAPRLPLPPAASGIVFALGVWTGSYLGWLPALHVLPPATRQPAGRNRLMIAAHVVWGTAMGLIAHGFNRLGKESQDDNRMAKVERSIRVKVPLMTAYNRWLEFKEFTRFLEDVRVVKETDSRRVHGPAEGGSLEEAGTLVTERVPGHWITWRSASGPRNAGTISFQRLSDRAARLVVRVEFDPEGIAKSVGDKPKFVAGRVENHLKRFKEYAESRAEASGGVGQGERKRRGARPETIPERPGLGARATKGAPGMPPEGSPAGRK